MSAKKILVVDDELGIRELLRDILVDEGFEIFVAENATEALLYPIHHQLLVFFLYS